MLSGWKLTVDVVGVDVLDGGTANVSRLSSESDSPQLVHPTQLENKHKSPIRLLQDDGYLNVSNAFVYPIRRVFVYLTAGGVVQGAGGEAGKVTKVLEEVEARHADGLWLQLGHLETHSEENNETPLIPHSSA